MRGVVEEEVAHPRAIARLAIADRSEDGPTTATRDRRGIGGGPSVEGPRELGEVQLLVDVAHPAPPAEPIDLDRFRALEALDREGIDLVTVGVEELVERTVGHLEARDVADLARLAERIGEERRPALFTSGSRRVLG